MKQKVKSYLKNIFSQLIKTFKQKKHRNISFAIIFISFATLALIFQNCAKMGFSTSDDLSSQNSPCEIEGQAKNSQGVCECPKEQIINSEQNKCSLYCVPPLFPIDNSCQTCAPPNIFINGKCQIVKCNESDPQTIPADTTVKVICKSSNDMLAEERTKYACKNGTIVKDSSSIDYSKCPCPNGKVSDAITGACSCPADKSYLDSNNNCTSTAPACNGASLPAEPSPPACPSGSGAVSKTSCTPSCPSGNQWKFDCSWNYSQCQCPYNQTVNPSNGSCACPSGKMLIETNGVITCNSCPAGETPTLKSGTSNIYICTKTSCTSPNPGPEITTVACSSNTVPGTTGQKTCNRSCDANTNTWPVNPNSCQSDYSNCRCKKPNSTPDAGGNCPACASPYPHMVNQGGNNYACLNCFTSFQTYNANTEKCEACPSGTYFIAASNSCQACPNGYDSGAHACNGSTPAACDNWDNSSVGNLDPKKDCIDWY